ncbi:MAG: 50S ribosome-binding GTPase [Hadesarchaea archaeon]|nr:50S ribosome-binding GTPase [Hadesarchaea archaeon]
MPANLPPEYLKAEERYLRARTLEEKILATQELIRLAPKHKGTEKLLKVLKRRLSKLREELRRQEMRRVGGGPSFHVKKEGVAQVALVGTPNSGKSTLLRQLTGAQPEVADYPFTTREPVPGMMQFEDVQIQLVEVPAIIEGSCLGRGLGARPLSAARNADAIALVVDASNEPLRQMETLLSELWAAGIRLNGLVPMEGDEFLEHRESVVDRRAMIVATKGDLPGAGEGFELLRREYGERFPAVLVLPMESGLMEVRRLIFQILGLVRVYTKRPDERPSERPLVLPKGSTVLDVARAVHKDIARDLKFARVWGSARFPGQQVPRDYVLQDKDVVELHV